MQRYRQISLAVILWAPILIVTAGVILRFDPLGMPAPLGALYAVPLSFWMVRRMDHAPADLGIPAQQAAPWRARWFGFSRVASLIVALWLPREVVVGPVAHDILGLIVFAKVFAYTDLHYWIVQLNKVDIHLLPTLPP